MRGRFVGGVAGLICGVAMVLAAEAPATAPAEVKPLVTDGLPGYKLAWSDEFGGAELNRADWVYRTDSKHWSTQLAENVSVADGSLRLALKKQQAGGMEYTGAGVISKRTFKYGYYEARFKCPAGKGWHSSFWMMNHDGSGGTATQTARQEIDVCEQDSNVHTRYSANVHAWHPKHETFGKIHPQTADLSADFHVWGCEFTAERIVFYFDGKRIGERDATKFAHNEQHIWLTSIASHLGGTDQVDDAALPAFMSVDYVRFFEKVQRGTL